MTNYRGFLREYRRAYEHKGGIKSLALGRLDPDWFKAIQAEMTWVIGSQSSSDVTDKKHTTNWTRPVGQARQFSLYNPTGKSDEYLSDFVPPARTPKRLVFPQLSATARFAALFGEDLWNLRLNGLGTSSKLSFHEEDPITPKKEGIEYIVRLHLPIFTNPTAEVILDGESFHFDEGILYFFHHGCVHSAVNGGADPRYHFVLDCRLTPELFDKVFPGSGPSPDAGFRRCDWAEAWVLAPGCASPIEEFVTESGQVIRGRLDYGRRAPNSLSYYRKSYPTVFRPLDRLLGRTG
jgi:hypothetical protein